MLAKKSLGQNWLRSASARAAIIAAAELKPGERVLEIGPGEGFLTEALLASGARVLAVEKDDRLIEFLNQKFSAEIKAGKLEIKHDDILNFDPAELGPYKLIANIPYYLTGQIIQNFLTSPNQPERLVLMLQKEVAERICARNGKESLLSISVKVFGEPKYVKTVPAGAFVPAPAVDSAILLIKNISHHHFSGVSEEKFFQIVKRGFAHKRKLLRGNLACGGEVLAACGIDPQARAENVTISQWLCLSAKF